jgi:DNA repair protein RadC
MCVRDIPTYQLLSMLTRDAVCKEDVQRPLLEVFKVPSRSDYPTQLLIVGELMQRALIDSLRERTYLENPTAVKDYLKTYFAGYEHEAFVCLFLDARFRLIDCQEMFRGTLTNCVVHPREIVKAALKRNAASVLIAHNHPSGDCVPSRADHVLTAQIRSALSTIDVPLVDHLVIAGTSHFSFAEVGELI